MPLASHLTAAKRVLRFLKLAASATAQKATARPRTALNLIGQTTAQTTRCKEVARRVHSLLGGLEGKTATRYRQYTRYRWSGRYRGCGPAPPDTNLHRPLDITAGISSISMYVITICISARLPSTTTPTLTTIRRTSLESMRNMGCGKEGRGGKYGTSAATGRSIITRLS